MNRILYLTLGLVTLALTMGCRSAHQRARLAEERGLYDEAARRYSQLYRLTPARLAEERGYYAWHAGENYLRLRMYERALTSYRWAERGRYPDSLLLLRLATTLHATGAYVHAGEYYSRYLAHAPESHLATVGLAGVRLALEDTVPARYTIARADLFNSTASDYSPAYSSDGNTLYITSHRARRGAIRSDITGEADADVYTLRRSALGVWAGRLDTLRGSLRSEADEGTPSLSSAGNELYYSYAAQTPVGEATAHIYRATSAGEAGWNRGQRLPLWSDTTVMAAHPSLSPSGRTLFFVSDAVGGFGGKDIYCAELDALGAPCNLGTPINTPGDELFPYAESDSLVYFSSLSLIHI